MSQYGAPPPSSEPAYSPYGYGQPRGGYASWSERVRGTLWDLVYLWPAFVLLFVALVLVAVGAADDSGSAGRALVLGLGGLVYLVSVVVAIVRYILNYIVDQGRTGFTYGKRRVGIRVVVEVTGQAPGVGSCVGRYFLHAIIGSVFYLDYLWPLWDDKVQTLTDKVLGTVVLKQPR